MRRIVILIGIFVLLTSHELFLKSNSYFLSPGVTTELFLYNGTFTTSENGIETDRIINPVINAPTYKYSPPIASFRIENNITYFPFTAEVPGSYVAGISTLPRILEQSPDAFREYLKHEGLDKAIDISKDGAGESRTYRERYSKHVKALLQVGEERTTVSEPLGYPVEFIPLQNPYETGSKKLLRFRLLYQGKPLAGQTVHCSCLHNGRLITEKQYRTNGKGEIEMYTNVPGYWYLSSIYMVRTDEDPEADYESNWATITFEVR